MSEIVAKWIASTGIEPVQLIDTTDTEFDHVQSTSDSLEISNPLDKPCNTNDISECNLEKSSPLPLEAKNEDENSAGTYILGKVQWALYY